MHPSRIEALVDLLPATNAYRRMGWSSGGAQTNEEVHVFAKANMDPAFGWVFVQAFLEAKQAPPLQVTESSILRGWCYQKYRRPDRDVRLAFQLRTEAERNRRIFLECMLLLGIDREQIASELQLTSDAVEIYHDLFWNVQDRTEDLSFISNLVYPHTTQITWLPGYHIKEMPEMLALRAAQSGGLETVKVFLGAKPECQETGSEASSKVFESQIVSAAVQQVRMGLLHQNGVAAIAHGRAVLQSVKMGGQLQPTDDDQAGLGSLGSSLMEHFLRTADTERTQRLKMQSMRRQGVEVFSE